MREIRYFPTLIAVAVLNTLVLMQCKLPEAAITPKSSAKEITNLSIDGLTGAAFFFDAATTTFSFTVPAATDVTALKLTFTLPAKATAQPASGSTQNFTNPVVYTVTAEDGTTQRYTVRVLVQSVPRSSQKQILSFAFNALSPPVSASINQSTFAITAQVPATANIKALTPTITVSDKASVAPASGAVQDFTNPLSYTVTAEDGSRQIYSVTITQASTSAANATTCRPSRIGTQLPGETNLRGSGDWRYDSDQNLLSYGYVSPSGQSINVRFTYLNGWVLTKETSFPIPSNPTSPYLRSIEERYSYDFDKGRLDSYREILNFIDPKTNIVQPSETTHQFEYDANGLLATYSRFGGNQVAQVKTYTRGILTKIEERADNGSIYEIVDGRVVKITSKNEFGGYRQYTYNANGQISRTAFYFSGRLSSYTDYEYLPQERTYSDIIEQFTPKGHEAILKAESDGAKLGFETRSRFYSVTDGTPSLSSATENTYIFLPNNLQNVSNWTNKQIQYTAGQAPKESTFVVSFGFANCR